MPGHSTGTPCMPLARTLVFHWHLVCALGRQPHMAVSTCWGIPSAPRACPCHLPRCSLGILGMPVCTGITSAPRACPWGHLVHACLHMVGNSIVTAWASSMGTQFVPVCTCWGILLTHRACFWHPPGCSLGRHPVRAQGEHAEAIHRHPRYALGSHQSVPMTPRRFRMYMLVHSFINPCVPKGGTPYVPVNTCQGIPSAPVRALGTHPGASLALHMFPSAPAGAFHQHPYVPMCTCWAVLQHTMLAVGTHSGVPLVGTPYVPMCPSAHVGAFHRQPVRALDTY
ncbi:hypothetical protein ACH5RR_012929 [Cinchona calisaya]|uniref:Uncharacterized protein n=1 Tax=Cinchona calisaya TaxID=153742 RepID=A0ABD3A197_9GENT